jgi:hypothetical protein
MMPRKVVTTPTGRACQTASLLLILVMVLGMLVEDIVRNAAGPDAAHAETCPLGSSSCPGSQSTSRQSHGDLVLLREEIAMSDRTSRRGSIVRRRTRLLNVALFY